MEMFVFNEKNAESGLSKKEKVDLSTKEEVICQFGKFCLTNLLEKYQYTCPMWNIDKNCLLVWVHEHDKRLSTNGSNEHLDEELSQLQLLINWNLG